MNGLVSIRPTARGKHHNNKNQRERMRVGENVDVVRKGAKGRRRKEGRKEIKGKLHA